MQRDENGSEENFEGEERERGSVERIRSQQTYRRAPKPKRRGTANVSSNYNGLHRRRNKRVDW